jgi:hypothetical protein
MRALFLAALTTAACGFSRTPSGLADALAARSLLGTDTWSRIVRIEYAGDRGLQTRTGYPSATYALIFELSGILWFYCDTDGTQSLSVRRGSADSDKLNPGPLFKAISPKFGAWEWVDSPAHLDEGRHGQPPNDCFIECLAILRGKIAEGTELHSPRLLFYYVNTATGRLGHTVLTFLTQYGLMAVDPEIPGEEIGIPADAAGDLRSIAHFLRGGNVACARELPLDEFGAYRAAPRWSNLQRVGPPAG